MKLISTIALAVLLIACGGQHKKYRVTQYSSGYLKGIWITSTGIKSQNGTHSFRDNKTGKDITVSGDILIEEIKDR